MDGPGSSKVSSRHFSSDLSLAIVVTLLLAVSRFWFLDHVRQVDDALATLPDHFFQVFVGSVTQALRPPEQQLPGGGFFVVGQPLNLALQLGGAAALLLQQLAEFLNFCEPAPVPVLHAYSPVSAVGAVAGVGAYNTLVTTILFERAGASAFPAGG